MAREGISLRGAMAWCVQRVRTVAAKLPPRGLWRPIHWPLAHSLAGSFAAIAIFAWIAGTALPHEPELLANAHYDRFMQIVVEPPAPELAPAPQPGRKRTVRNIFGDKAGFDAKLNQAMSGMGDELVVGSAQGFGRVHGMGALPMRMGTAGRGPGSRSAFGVSKNGPRAARARRRTRFDREVDRAIARAAVKPPETPDAAWTSTFAADVDTASYALVKRALERRRWPTWCSSSTGPDR